MSVEKPKIFCLGCDYPLDGLKGEACPECGRPFDLNDIETFRRGLGLPRLVYRGPSMLDIHFKRHLLESEGIPTQITFDGAGLAFATGALLYVEAADEDRARAILNEAQKTENASESTDDSDAGVWTCPKCGELVDGDFEMCWNCETPKPQV